jgi:pilus assembly protein CpaC
VAEIRLADPAIQIADPVVAAATPRLPGLHTPRTIAPSIVVPAAYDVRPDSRPAPAPGRPVTGRTDVGAVDAPTDLELGKGTLIRLRRPVATVFVANPAIADVQVKSPTLIYVLGKAPGETVLYAVDESEEVLLNTTLRVKHNLTRLRQSLKALMPDEPISVESIDGALVVSGMVSSAARAEDARAMAAVFVAQSPGGTVMNRMAVVAPNQVNLRVRIAEVNRNTLKEMGINWDAITQSSRFAFGLLTGNPVTQPDNITRNIAQIGYSVGGTNINAIIDALGQEGLITILAEPNLTALSGQTASFLAGGEFPIPVAEQASTTGGVPTITIVFKKFGVALEFTPTILDGSRINLRVRPEVSQLSTVGAVQINNFSIPALTVRRAETSVELGSGESFAIAGLLENDSQQDVSKIPGLGDVPVLGGLFRSDRYKRNETELAIIVTPYIVRPVSNPSALVLPTDGLIPPNDAQRVLTGDNYRPGLPPRQVGPRGQGGQGLIGSAGFSLD